MVRRSTSYGPMLPDGVLEDDGTDRGIIFVAGGARLDRQFEYARGFIPRAWPRAVWVRH